MKTRALWALWAVSCAPAAAPGGAPATPGPGASAPAPPAPSHTAPAPTASAAPAPTASAAPAPAESPPAAPEPGAREVQYVVTGGKLEIVVDGVRFKPSARAIRVGQGWGIALEVDAEAQDDRMHSLLKPKGGALALAVKVTRKGGKQEERGDAREGADEDFVTPGTVARLERTWPDRAGERPLSAGDKVVLQVGLWGIGADASSRRPVKKLFVVTMSVGKGEPRPFVAAPE